jgi:hypothetical protein
MFRTILIASTLISGAAFAAPDIRTVPGGVLGNAPLHVDGTESGGAPIIHRPEARPGSAVRNGPAILDGGAQQPGVSYRGNGTGSHGNSKAPVITGVDEGRPVLQYPG